MSIDNIDKRAEEGLRRFESEGDLSDVKKELDARIDNLLSGAGPVSDDPDENPPSSGSRKFIWILLSLLGLILIGYLGYSASSKKDTPKTKSELYAAYFSVMNNVSDKTVRGETSVNSDTDLGMQYYEKGQYENAVKILGLSQTSKAQMYAGIASMAQNDHKIAIEFFDKARSFAEAGDYIDIIEWYQALAMMKTNDIESSRILFNRIVNNKSYQYKKAKQILEVI